MDRRTLQKRYNEVLQEVQYLRDHSRHLQLELQACRPELYRANRKIDRLKQRVKKLSAEKTLLIQKVADLTEQVKHQPKPAVPPFVKANVPNKPAKKPGRKKGHVAALRPMPEKIDVHQVVAVPVDTLGKPSCPQCRTQLSDVKHHQRIVEDIVPSKVITTCYHTTSGWCPCCGKQVESRAEDQPPTADLPHAQFGLNALATAACCGCATDCRCGRSPNCFYSFPD